MGIPVRVRDRAPLCVRAACSTSGRPSSSRARRATWASTGRRGSRSRTSCPRPSGSRRCRAREARGRLRPRLRHDRPRLTALAEGGVELVSWDVGFDLARAVKSEAEVESVRAQRRPHQQRGLLDLPRGLRGGAHRGGDPGRVRALLGRRGVRPLDDGHGARGRRARPCLAGVPDREHVTPHRAGRLHAAVARGRRPGGHWVEVSRAIKAGADPNAETLRMAEAYEEYAAVAPAALKAGGPRTTHTGPSCDRSPTGATRSAT